VNVWPDHLESELLDLVEGQPLAPEARAKVEAALAADATLRALVDGMRADRAGLCAMAAAPAPADLLDRVEAALEREALLGLAQRERSAPAALNVVVAGRIGARPWWAQGWARAGAAAAALALVSGAVWLSVRGRDHGEPGRLVAIADPSRTERSTYGGSDELAKPMAQPGGAPGREAAGESEATGRGDFGSPVAMESGNVANRRGKGAPAPMAARPSGGVASDPAAPPAPAPALAPAGDAAGTSAVEETRASAPAPAKSTEQAKPMAPAMNSAPPRTSALPAPAAPAAKVGPAEKAIADKAAGEVGGMSLEEAARLARAGRLLVFVSASSSAAEGRVQALSERAPRGGVKLSGGEAGLTAKVDRARVREAETALASLPKTAPGAAASPPVRAHTGDDAKRRATGGAPGDGGGTGGISPTPATMQPIGGASSGPVRRLFVAQLNGEEASLRALMQMLERSDQVVRFEALGEAVPVEPKIDARSILWWADSPSAWRARVNVPVLLEHP
jgi:hypothetical protein